MNAFKKHDEVPCNGSSKHSILPDTNNSVIQWQTIITSVDTLVTNNYICQNSIQIKFSLINLKD